MSFAIFVQQMLYADALSLRTECTLLPIDYSKNKLLEMRNVSIVRIILGTVILRIQPFHL